MSYSKQDLAQFGKRASDMHIKHGMPLSESVVKVAQATPNLTKHHVTRILENANLVTFEERFNNGDNKHVNFTLADPREVFEALEGNSPAPQPISDEYLAPPPSAIDDEFDPPIEKASSYTDVNTDFALQRELASINSAIQHVSSDLSRIDSDVQHGIYKLASSARVAALQSNSRYAPLELMGHAATDKAVFQKVAHAVVKDLGDADIGHFEDRAPNLEHPLCKQYKNVESLIKEAQRHKNGLKVLETARQRLVVRMNEG